MSDKERSLAWDLADITMVFVGALGLWGIASTGAFDGTPAEVFGNGWFTGGLALLIAGILIDPRVQAVRRVLGLIKGNNKIGEQK